MRWSQTTTLEGLTQEITFLTGLDTNAVSDKIRARHANEWYHKAALLAWKSDPDWQFDDPNIATSQSDNSWTYDATFVGLPRATRDMVDDTRIYRLPTNAFSVERVEVKRSDGNFYVVDPIEESKIPRTNALEGAANFAISEFYKTKGMPRYYNLVGANIELFPAPDSTQTTITAGLKIYVARTIDKFISTDSSQEPALPEQFHHILSLGASYDIAVAKGLENAKTLKARLDELFFEMQDYYTKRQRHNKKSIRPSRRSYL